MRITSDVLEYHAGGKGEADFPELEAADFRAIYAFAADRGRRLVLDSSPRRNAALVAFVYPA